MFGKDIAWSPYSKLCVRSDGYQWVLSNEAMELKKTARRLGVPVIPSVLYGLFRRQCVFYSDQFSLLDSRKYEQPHRYAVALFHGRPGRGVQEFDRMFEAVRRQDRVRRIQVSHRAMACVLANFGVDRELIHVIPIGINLSFFPSVTTELRNIARSRLQIPASAFVVGSFQKDGVGWGEGREPKLIKGPDVLLRTIEILKPQIPNLFVLLSGPARGYVKTGLERIGVPYKHKVVKKYRNISALYHALDVYVVSSREEGGPKAVLEAMAGGIPLVSTKVGQATDLVQHGRNGWLAEIEDAEGLAGLIRRIYEDQAGASGVVRQALLTARENSYEAQLPLWTRFFDGFISPPGL
jgi:glycosyltransferase involved in cell wall biosynthesis